MLTGTKEITVKIDFTEMLLLKLLEYQVIFPPRPSTFFADTLGWFITCLSYSTINQADITFIILFCVP